MCIRDSVLTSKVASRVAAIAAMTVMDKPAQVYCCSVYMYIMFMGSIIFKSCILSDLVWSIGELTKNKGICYV